MLPSSDKSSRLFTRKINVIIVVHHDVEKKNPILFSHLAKVRFSFAISILPTPYHSKKKLYSGNQYECFHNVLFMHFRYVPAYTSTT